MQIKKIINVICFTYMLSVSTTVSIADEISNTMSSENNITEKTSTDKDAKTVLSSEVKNKDSSKKIFWESSTEETNQTYIKEIELYDQLNMYPGNRSDIEPSRYNSKTYSDSRLSIPIVNVTDKNTPQKGFIDVSSHNGNVSVEDFKKMKGYGVTGVVVKLTEATTYTNPFAASQVANAKQAGLKVSAYHYSWFTNEEEARREADYFVSIAKSVGLTTSTVMVNDIEEPQIIGKADHTLTSVAFQKRLNELGYGNVTHYMGAHWLNSGLINSAVLGYKNIWVAAYPYDLSTEQQYSEYGAWQWSSKLNFPGISGTFDISSDYSGRYTNAPSIEIPGLSAPRLGLWYRSHVSDYGWLGYMGTEGVSGTTGQNRRLEAIDVRWNKNKSSIRSSFQDINGKWVETGYGITGTVGRALAVQKVCFASETELLKTGRKIQYRVHSQDVGWSAWKEEGQPAGTGGKKIEAIEMRMTKNGIVEKG